jgi:hypothetical protein
MENEEIEIIDFNEPQDTESLILMLQSGKYPAFFRFDIISTGLHLENLLIDYERHENEDNKKLWLLIPPKPIEPHYVILQGQEKQLGVVYTETNPNSYDDITLFFGDKTSINLREFQLKIKQETFRNEDVLQR